MPSLNWRAFPSFGFHHAKNPKVTALSFLLAAYSSHERDEAHIGAFHDTAIALILRISANPLVPSKVMVSCCRAAYLSQARTEPA